MTITVSEFSFTGSDVILWVFLMGMLGVMIWILIKNFYID